MGDQEPSDKRAPGQDDADVRRAFDAGDYETAATLFIERHGNEIIGFLGSRLRNPTDAAEVFSVFAEDFWRGLPTFQWRASIRGWAYTLARNAAYRHRHGPERARLQMTTMGSDKGRFAQAVDQLRTATKMHLRSEVKQQMRSLYRQLPDDDRSVLYLRIDKRMPWTDIARIMSGQGEAMEDAEVKRWANRLRQRFHVIKHRLRKLAKAEGLL
ncbi:MAG: sigma-70 family RNA polymerase sigma factor [Myxococcales bacterium]|nr:sigma-70 family RNA polymerase sigma factor [Myxococcales bacterium]